MATAKSLIDRLRATRPGYQDERREHRFFMDSYAGTGGFRGDIRERPSSFWGPAADIYADDALDADWSDVDRATYLIRYPREDTPKFQRRVNAAHYTNFVEPIVDLRLSYMLRKEFTVEGGEGNRDVEAFLADADAHGLPLWTWLERRVIRRAAITGWVPVVVDLPRVDGVVGEMNRAQQAELGLRPRCIAHWPANLLDYSHDGDSFVWAKLRTDHVLQADPLAPANHVERYTLWTHQAFRVVEVDAGDNGGVLSDTDWVPHGFGRVPLAILRHQPIDSDPVRGLSMVNDLAHAARALFNRESELDEHLRSQVFAILSVVTEEPGKLSELTLGSSNALALHPEARNPHQFIAPPASVAETYENRLERGEQALYRMGRVEYSRQTGAPQSAASRRYSFDHTNRAIAAYAREVAFFLEELFRIVGAVTGADVSQVSVTPPQDFDVQALDTELRAILDARGMNLGPTAHKALKSRVVDRVVPGLPTAERAAIDEELEQLADVERAELAMTLAGGDPGADPGPPADE